MYMYIFYILKYSQRDYSHAAAKMFCILAMANLM